MIYFIAFTYGKNKVSNIEVDIKGKTSITAINDIKVIEKYISEIKTDKGVLKYTDVIITNFIPLRKEN